MLSFKVILLGDATTGKSSIIDRYIKDSFDSGVLNTVGPGFYSKAIEIFDEFVKLHIWDTSGQEKYRAINQTYFHDSDAAILVYDLSNISSIDGVQYYFEQIKDSCDENIDLTVVGNKFDLVDKDDNGDINMAKSKNDMHYNNARYFTSSAKTGKNISE